MTCEELNKIKEQLDNLEDIANIIVIRKGVTNGEVIRAVFPTENICKSNFDVYMESESMEFLDAEFNKFWWKKEYGIGD